MKIELLFDNMKYIREEYELSQLELAKILEVSQSNYSRWESCSKIIPLNKLNDLCNYFNVNMDYVIGLTNKRKNMTNDNVLDKKAIGKNIRLFRIKYKLTQKDLANYLNTTQSVISSYERGNTLILTPFAAQICFNYKISLDALCNRK